MSDDVEGPDWANLLEDLVVLIFKHLHDWDDVFRFEAICRPWRLAAITAELKHQHEIKPLLVRHESYDSLMFLDLSKQKFFGEYQLPLRESDNINIRYSKGWLVRATTGSGGNSWVFKLLNPFTREHINLPPLAITSTSSRVSQTPSDAILSCSPMDPACIVAVYFGPTLAFCSSTSSRWETQCADVSYSLPFQKLGYHKDDFYLIQGQGNIFLCNKEPQPKLLQVAPPPPGGWSFIELEEIYFVESSVDLLMVKKFQVGGSSQNFTFQLLKMDFSKGEWVVVKCLGDNSIFIAGSGATLISTKHFHEFRGDYIYFVFVKKANRWFSPDDIMMFRFSLRTQQIEECFQLYWPWIRLDRACSWLVPDLYSLNKERSIQAASNSVYSFNRSKRTSQSDNRFDILNDLMD